MYWGEEEGDDHHPGSDDQVKKRSPFGPDEFISDAQGTRKKCKIPKIDEKWAF